MNGMVFDVIQALENSASVQSSKSRGTDSSRRHQLTAGQPTPWTYRCKD